MKTTDFGFPSIATFDDEIKNTPKYSDYSNVVDLVMDYVETNGMSEEEIERLRSEVEDMVKARADELKENAQWERADVVGEDNELDHEIVNDFSIDAIKDNFTPPGAKSQKGKTKDVIDTNDNGKIEKSEMETFTDSLNDYMSKNKKGRDDIPVATRRR